MLKFLGSGQTLKKRMMNATVVVRVRIRTDTCRLTAISCNLGDKTFVSSCAFFLLALLL